MKLPHRWLMYENSARINNTPFVACKVPLRENYSTKLSSKNSFTPKLLLKKHPEIKLVIDLTNTTKYYSGEQEFVANGIQYVKISCKGGNVPSESQFQRFLDVVDEFLRTNPSNHLIAVHCTHGVNRTGYFIVRFLIEKMGYNNEKALNEFTRFRFHRIYRTNLIKDLLKRTSRHPSGR